MSQNWSSTPKIVQDRVNRGRQAQRAIARVAKHLPKLQSGYGQIFWHPQDHALWVVTGDGDETSTVHRWENALKAVPGVEAIRCEAEYFPPERDDWVQIKQANGPLEWLRKPFEWSGKLTGGPTPLSNAIAGGLLAGGLGYAGGALADLFMPHDYIEPGANRRAWGTLGLLAGMTPGMLQGLGNYSVSADTDKPLGWKAWLTRDKDVPISETARTLHNNRIRTHAGGIPVSNDKLAAALGDTPTNTKLLQLVKSAESPTGLFASTMKPVSVDAFNNAIWHDVRLGQYAQNTQHTPPAAGAAATGIVSGIQEMYGGAPLLSPMHFVKGLAAAGVDGTTAHIAGGTLGALGILTPKAQSALQTAGVWGGLVRGVTGSLLGVY